MSPAKASDQESGSGARRSTRARKRRTDRRASLVGIGATAAAVIAVHGTNLQYRLFYDDYVWLDTADHKTWIERVVLPEGTGVYRPLLSSWFALMRSIFGMSSLPYHVVALGFMIAAALAVRWLASELGLTNLPATIAGVVFGSYAALAPTTIWASAAQSPAAVALAASSIALICRPSIWRQLAAAVLLAAAIGWRDVTVMTPVIATILLVAWRLEGTRPAPPLRATTSLWVVAGGYAVYRAVQGAVGSDSGPYATDFFGSHVLDNLRSLMKITARFGLAVTSEEVPAGLLSAWTYFFWLLLVGLAVWAARKHSYLPLAGIACFFVSLGPLVGFTRHPMDLYYIDLGVVGLALSVGSLVSLARLSSAVVIPAVVIFVLVQVATVRVYQDRGLYPAIIERTDFLEETARHAGTADGALVIVTPCPRDKQWALDGRLFRVMRGEPDLRVRFEIDRSAKGPTSRAC